MKKITEMAHDLLLPYVHKQAVCADFTMGNGNDTLFFAKLAVQGTIYAFDIQEAALAHTSSLLNEQLRAHVQLILDNHVNLASYIHKKLDAAVFNFGYLPQGNTQITTQAKESIIAVDKAFQLCRRHGMLVLVCYCGNKQQMIEAQAIGSWCEALSNQQARIMKIQMVNKPHAPFLYGVERLIE